MIATFTIPKILDSGNDSEFNAIAKEAMAMVSGAYQAYKQNSPATSNTALDDLTPYLNYVKQDTVSLVDGRHLAGSRNCSVANERCFPLHSGGVLHYRARQFGGTGLTNALNFQIDPDGIYSASTTGPGKSVEFYLYFNGRLTTRGNIEPNTQCDTNTYQPEPTYDPPWFSWSN